MFLLDSLLISGLRWTLETIRTAADRELNDETALREQLLDAEMRRELGEIDDETFRTVEADVLSRMRAIREARGGAAAAFAIERPAGHTAGGFTVEATVAGDFHERPAEPAADTPAQAPPVRPARSQTPRPRPRAEAARRRRAAGTQRRGRPLR